MMQSLSVLTPRVLENSKIKAINISPQRLIKKKRTYLFDFAQFVSFFLLPSF